MHSNDVKDLWLSFGLLMLFIIGTAVYQSLYEENVVFERIEIDDNVDLFLLNYLKTKSEDGEMIKELILEAEDDEEAFETLKEESENILDIANVRRHNIKIIYPGVERAIGDDDFEEFSEISLSNKNGDLILVKIGVEFVREWA